MEVDNSPMKLKKIVVMKKKQTIHLRNKKKENECKRIIRLKKVKKK